jgi:hypothetical protein
MYILYKKHPETEIIGAKTVGQCLDFVMAELPEEAVEYAQLDKNDATILTDDERRGCRFAWAYKDTINIKKGQTQYTDLFSVLVESGEEVEKVPYTLTDEDKSQAVAFLKVVFNKLLKEFYDVQYEQLNKRVPKAEKELWAAQRLEATRYLKDNTTPTPILSQLAAVRGITVPEMANLVVSKIDQYETDLVGLLVRQQKVQKEIAACNTLKELHYLGATRFNISAFPYEWIHGATDVPEAALTL